MGHAEDYYDQFYRWFSKLEENERQQFIQENPEPSDWSGFYRTIIVHPWL